MTDEYDDDYDDIFERIKDYLNIDPEKFDFDIIFMPEMDLNQNFNPDNEIYKGFKVTYHFEKGMDKPDVRIEGDFDNEKLKEYINNLNVKNNPRLKPFVRTQNKNVLDSNNLTLQPREEEFPMKKKDPYYEVNSTMKGAEIVMEAPGVEKGHVILSLSENRKKLKIIVKNKFNEFEKIIKLPFEPTLENHSLEINNGIISIEIHKK
jgi:HSP20 family molecular chaperone IbpA